MKTTSNSVALTHFPLYTERVVTIRVIRAIRGHFARKVLVFIGLVWCSLAQFGPKKLLLFLCERNRGRRPVLQGMRILPKVLLAPAGGLTLGGRERTF